MEKGKTIRIYLNDGTVSGIRHTEIINWTGQAISCPRKHLPSLAEWPECTRPGVYFLFGIDDATAQPSVYIGETENVYERLQQHFKEKDFWQEVIFFTNKDENLTKAHIKYLESRLVSLAKDADRYIVMNSNQPTCSSLPRSDKAAMEEFIRYQVILLGTMGHRVLEPLADFETKSINADISNLDNPSNELFYINAKNKKSLATAQRTDEGMVIQTNSRAVVEIASSLSNGNKNLRESLVEKGLLQKEGNYYIFTKDVLLASPSQAASVVLGYSVNGRESWINAMGKSLKVLEEESIEK